MLRTVCGCIYMPGTLPPVRLRRVDGQLGLHRKMPLTDTQNELQAQHLHREIWSLSRCSSGWPGTLERTVCLCLLSAGWQQRRAPPHRQTHCSCFPRAKRTRTGGPQNSDFRFQCSGVAGGVRCIWGCVHRDREGVWNTGASLSCGPGQACLWVVRRYGSRKWIEEAGQVEPSCCCTSSSLASATLSWPLPGQRLPHAKVLWGVLLSYLWER